MIGDVFVLYVCAWLGCMLRVMGMVCGPMVVCRWWVEAVVFLRVHAPSLFYCTACYFVFVCARWLWTVATVSYHRPRPCTRVFEVRMVACLCVRTFLFPCVAFCVGCGPSSDQ